MNLTQLLELTINQNASDLHLVPNMPPLLRINGELFSYEALGIIHPTTLEAGIRSTLSEEQFQTLQLDWELDYVLQSEKLRFRVNAYRQTAGIAAVFRYIPNTISTLEQLAVPPIVKNLLDIPSGLILVTGATGSGKSTTLAAMINHINTHQRAHIITLEDPIEFIHTSQKSLVTQRQIQVDTKSFAGALRSAVRQDPNVILVGEMRDLETIRLALTAAETGHLVMATLHTSSASRTIHRIVDVFPAGEKHMVRHLLAESLQAVICQTLVQKPAGGRIAAFEILLGTSAVRNLIREDKIAQLQSVMQTGHAQGMCTMEQALSQIGNGN